MNSQNQNNVKVTGTKASETSVLAGMNELATQVFINSSDNVNWNMETEKFEITEAKIIKIQTQIKWIKGFFEDDAHCPKPHTTDYD